MKVAIIMGSTSDLDIMSQAINVLEGFGVEVVKRVISAHRTPDLMCEFAKSAKSEESVSSSPEQVGPLMWQVWWQV